jgi:hypothetical protein
LEVLRSHEDAHRKKRQLLALVRVFGTIFRALNQIEIAKINQHIKNVDKERKLLVDITQINSQSIDKLERSVEDIIIRLEDMALYNMPLIEVHLRANLEAVTDEFDSVKKMV